MNVGAVEATLRLRFEDSGAVAKFRKAIQDAVGKTAELSAAQAQRATDRYVKSQIAASRMELAERQANAAAGVKLAQQRAQAEQAAVTAGIKAMQAREAAAIRSAQQTAAAEQAAANAGVAAMRAREAAAIRSSNAMNALHARALVENRKFDDALKRNTTSLGSWAGNLARSSLAAVGLGASIAGTVYTIYNMSKALIHAEVALTQIMLRLQVAAHGDMQRAGEMFEFIQHNAARVGVSLEDAAMSFSRFQANVRGTSLEGKEAEKVFIGVSEAAAAMGLSSYQVGRAFLAIEQMVSKGTVQMEELRGQLSEQIPGAFQSAAKAMGLTTTELGKMMKAGEIMATDLVPKLAEEWHKTFGPVAEQNAKRLTGAIAALESAWFLFKTEVTSGPGMAAVFLALAGAISGVTSAMKEATTAADKYIEQQERIFGLNAKISGQKASEMFAFTEDQKTRLREWHEALTLSVPGSFSEKTAQQEVNKIILEALDDAHEKVGALTAQYIQLAAQLGVTRDRAKELIDTGMFSLSAEGGARIGPNFDSRTSNAAGFAARLSKEMKAADEAAEEAAKDAKRAQERLTNRVADYRRELSDAAAVNAEFNRVLEVTGGSYELAEIAAREYAAVLSIGEGLTREQIVELYKLGLAQAEVEDATDKARRTLEQFIEVANADAEAMEDLQREQKALIDSAIDAQFEWQHEVEAAQDFVTAVKGGTVALREFNIQQEIVRRLKMFEELRAHFMEIGRPDRWAVFVAGVEGFVRAVDRLKMEAELAAEKMAILTDLAMSLFQIPVNTVIDAFAQFVKTGEFSFKELAKSLRDSFVDAFAKILKDWLLLQAQMAAADYAARRDAGGGGGSWWTSLIRAFGGGKTSGGSTLTSGTAVTAGGTGTNTLTGSVSGSYWAAFKGWATSASGAAVLGAIVLAAAVMIGRKQTADLKRSQLYGTGAGVGLGAGGRFDSSWVGKLNQTGPHVAKALADTANALIDATGVFVTSAQTAVVKIRNDKKLFQVEIEGQLRNSFATMNEAILYAVKTTFLNSTFIGTLDKAVRQAIQGFKGPAEEFGKAIEWVQKIVNEAKGLSDLDISLSTLLARITQVHARLREFGLTAANAMRLAGEWGIAQAQAAWRSISGQQMTPKEELAQKKASAMLLVAQLKLWRLELLARKAYLEGQIGLARAEWGGGGAGSASGLGGLKRQTLKAQVAFMKADVQITNSYLAAKAEGVGMLGKIYQAEIDVINETLKALDALLATIDIGKIRLGGGIGRGGGGQSKLEQLIDRWKQAMEDLIETVRDLKFNQATTALTAREQLTVAFADYRKTLGMAKGGNVTAAENLDEMLSRVLELAKSYTGGGTGLGFLGAPDSFRDFFDLLIKQSTNLALGPRPGTLTEGSVLYNEKMLRIAERTLLQNTKLTASSIDQNDTIIHTARQSVRVESAILIELRKLNQSATTLTKAG